MPDVGVGGKRRKKNLNFFVCFVLIVVEVVAFGLVYSFLFRKEIGHRKKSSVAEAIEARIDSLSDPDLARPLGVDGRPGQQPAEFSGQPFREFPKHKLVFSTESSQSAIIGRVNVSEARCRSSKWAVLTTVSEPMEAVRRLLYRREWCVVVIGDLVGPKHFAFNHTDLGDNVVFLDADDQKRMGSSFVDSTPWNSFARKNVGFLYAVAAGAQVIFDFDDDNMLKFWMEDASPDPLLELETFTNRTGTVDVLVPKMRHSAKEFNPYPLLGCPRWPCWPRGFPYRSVHRSSFIPADNSTSADRSEFELVAESVPEESVAVLQSLADHDPDVDAVHRLTVGTPFLFERTGAIEKPVLLPASGGVFSPMNAQATLHFRPGFFALFLPVTPHGRVTDIWRSYVAEAMFQVLGLRAGFLPRPLVAQDRNPHSYMADMDAEVPLYTQAGALVDYLARWARNKKNTSKEPAALMEEVYAGMYERGFVQAEDVESVQAWLAALVSLGYLSQGGGDEEESEGRDVLRLDLGKSAAATPVDPTEQPLPESCRQTREGLHFWSSDGHEGTRHDTPSVLARLGQIVYLGHPKLKNFSNKDGLFASVKASRGKVEVIRDLAPFLEEFTFRNTVGAPGFEQETLGHYNRSWQMARVEAFVCSFPASLCHLWGKFKRSIAFLPSHRYNMGRCSPAMWKELNNWLLELSVDTKRPHLLGAMNRYDLEYLRHYTGIADLKLVSTLSGFYTAGNDYIPVRSEILVFDRKAKRNEMQPWFQELIQEAGKLAKFRFEMVHELYHRYDFSNLTSHRAVVYLSYSVHSYTLTELYALKIPIFVPSLAFYRRNGGLGPDRTIYSHLYCMRNEARRHQGPLKYTDATGQSSLTRQPSKASHPYDPNIQFSHDKEAEMYWLQFADGYDWPHVTHFDDAADLVAKLEALDHVETHRRMERSYHIRQHRTLHHWCEFIKKIQDG